MNKPDQDIKSASARPRCGSSLLTWLRSLVVHDVATATKDARINVRVLMCKIRRSAGTRWRQVGQTVAGSAIGFSAADAEKNQVAQDVAFRTPPHFVGDLVPVADEHAHGGH